MRPFWPDSEDPFMPRSSELPMLSGCSFRRESPPIGSSAVWLAVMCLQIFVRSAIAQTSATPDAFIDQVRPLLNGYCLDCHSAESSEGGVALDHFVDRPSAIAGGRLWVRVLDAIESRAMPPEDAIQPSDEERAAAIEWIEDDFFMAQCATASSSAPAVIRRLNRQEYDNTIRDLLGLDLHLAADFPPDDIGFGYDNIGSVLNLSPVHMEKYLLAAERALEAAIRLPDVESLPPVELIGLRTYPLPIDGQVTFDHHLAPGRYLADFSLVRVGVDERVPPPRISISFGTDMRELEAVRVQDETIVYRFWIGVTEGDRHVQIKLAAGEAARIVESQTDASGKNTSGDQRYGADRGLHVDSMVVHGPLTSEPLPVPSGVKLHWIDHPLLGDEARIAAGRQVVKAFADRAFRRPARDDEIDRLLQLFAMAQRRGESFERCCQVTLSAVLLSPQFLYLVEPGEPNTDRSLTDYELASRLSYFLWSTMPDEALLQAAADGSLRKELSEQVDRMLKDPRSEALVSNFVGQWLQLRNLSAVTPDPSLFPEFDNELREAMRGETEACFAYLLRSNQSVLELLSADYTFLNQRLARHYGIEGVTGDQWQRIEVKDSMRGGILTHASVLALTSNPNRTSPVKRGKWILQQVLGSPPPPPPPNVADLDDSVAAEDAASLRERLELHRANPQCASCHRQMDALGFALENYDAIGRWRDRDGTFPIDSSGTLPGGRSFTGAAELKQVLTTSSAKKFSRNLIENLLTYALGRSLELEDYCLVESLRRRLVDADYRPRALIMGIVESDAFQQRGGEPSLEGTSRVQ
jgi:hypothetical protein